MKPKYFLCNDLLRPVMTAIEELETILSDANNLNKPYVIRGVFAYSIALFESTINDYLKRYYLGFPEEVASELEKVKIDGISYVFNSTFAYEVTERIIDDLLRDISFKSIEDILQRVNVSFGKAFKIEYHRKNLIEIKERRNLLMHNNLQIDKSYQVNTGILERVGVKIDISRDYLISAINMLIDILDQIKSFASQIFSDYTEEKLIKSVWEYFFENVLSFDQVSHMREDGLDFYPSDKLEKRKTSLSGSERTLLSLFLLNYNPDISQRYYASGHLNSQAGTSKLGELIELFDRYPLLLQRI